MACQEVYNARDITLFVSFRFWEVTVHVSTQVSVQGCALGAGIVQAKKPSNKLTLTFDLDGIKLLTGLAVFRRENKLRNGPF
jgi:hypothetical protein